MAQAGPQWPKTAPRQPQHGPEDEQLQIARCLWGSRAKLPGFNMRPETAQNGSEMTTKGNSTDDEERQRSGLLAPGAEFKLRKRDLYKERIE